MLEYEKNAKIFKAFSDSSRLKIINLLQNGELCACRLLEELNIGQPTLSHHMKILCDIEIVNGRKDGKWTYYSLNSEGIKNIRSLLENITTINSVKRDCCE